MKKLIALSLLGLSVASSSLALQADGAIWSCKPVNDLNACVSKVTSLTTPALMGALVVDPNKRLYFGATAADANATSVSGTLTLMLFGSTLASQSISASTNGNVIPYTNPYFTRVVISNTTPITGTSVVRYFVIEK